MKTPPAAPLPPNAYHLVTVGTTPPGAAAGGDVVEALGADLAAASPRHVTVLSTADSEDNARRLLALAKVDRRRSRIRLIDSAQSIDDAYRGANEEIVRLLDAGATREEIVLHYTAGTKVMSAGAVLAAANHGVHALRYLFSAGRGSTSVPLTTAPASMLADRQLRLALAFTRELSFRAAEDILAESCASLPEGPEHSAAGALRELAAAYREWDTFRVGAFLARYDRVAPSLSRHPDLADLVLPATARKRLLAAGAAGTGTNRRFPDEVLLDLVNNAIRRLAERRPDDALIRLHRAAELYAQGILEADFGIRTEDLDIRKVPPRSRMAFESERRVDDAKIKLGLRKSYDLLEILGHPVGKLYREHAAFRQVLDERRNLVLAHGVRPAPPEVALAFYREIEVMLEVRIPRLAQQLAAQQFPWIENALVLERLSEEPAGTESILAAGAGGKGKRRRGRRGGRRTAAKKETPQE